MGFTDGLADEKLTYFLARGLEFVGHQRDDDEFLEIFSLPLAEALAMVKSGEICEAKTVVALFWLEKIIAGDWSLEPASR
mgnify:CR=1 FL=1